MHRKLCYCKRKQKSKHSSPVANISAIQKEFTAFLQVLEHLQAQSEPTFM